jgi:hypothetical protein
VQAYAKRNCRFVLVARKTARLVDQLKAADWKASPRTDADGQCEFCYQPEGWGQAYRFLALRYEKQPQAGEADAPEQHQLFETSEYTFRVFVTNLEAPLDALVWFHNQRAGAENLIKEANNDAGLAAHPSKRRMMNANWFQVVMLAYTPWRRRACGSCSWRPRSGGMRGAWGSATATTTRRKASSRD